MDTSASPDTLDDSRPNIYLLDKRQRIHLSQRRRPSSSPSRGSPPREGPADAHSDQGPPALGLASGHGYERLRPPKGGPPTSTAHTIQNTVEAKKAPFRPRSLSVPAQAETAAAPAAHSDDESVASIESTATHDSVPVASIAATELAKAGYGGAFVSLAGAQAVPLEAPLAAHHLQDHRIARVLIDLFAGSGAASHGVSLAGGRPTCTSQSRRIQRAEGSLEPTTHARPFLDHSNLCHQSG